jgi:hypothetical protein
MTFSAQRGTSNSLPAQVDPWQRCVDYAASKGMAFRTRAVRRPLIRLLRRYDVLISPVTVREVSSGRVLGDALVVRASPAVLLWRPATPVGLREAPRSCPRMAAAPGSRLGALVAIVGVWTCIRPRRSPFAIAAGVIVVALTVCP